MNTETMRVKYTPDGDTVRCLRTVIDPDTERRRVDEVRVRLIYIDAPEMESPHYPRTWGLAARRYLRRLLGLGETVKVNLYGQDHYGRLLGEIERLRDAGNCGLRMVRGGYAALWQCPLDKSAYYDAQALAQRERRGIWAHDGPWRTPWLYR